MADVLTITVLLIALGLAYPALLATVRLFFPNRVERARARLEGRPWRCFWSGLGLAVLIGLPAALLASAPAGLLKFAGWGLITLGLGAAVFGAAALAETLETSTGFIPGPNRSISGLRGGVLLELAAAFPLVGWFLFLPASTLIALGSALPVLLARAPKTAEAAPAANPLPFTATGGVPTSGAPAPLPVSRHLPWRHAPGGGMGDRSGPSEIPQA